MESMRSTWTDERMDDLNCRVEELNRDMDARFDSVDARFDSIDQRFVSIDQRFVSIDRRLEALDERIDRRFDALQYTMLRIGAGMLATLAVGFAAAIVAHT
jgi:flagellar capping protein FliD